jgi:hypothetical protein
MRRQLFPSRAVDRARLWLELAIVVGFMAYLFMPIANLAFDAGTEFVASHRPYLPQVPWELGTRR